MIAFINEKSLEEHGNWANALLFFLEAAQQLASVQTPLKKDSTFFFDAKFKERFGSLSFHQDVQALIRQVVFSERYYKCWRPERISIDDVYLCDSPRLELLDESLGEAAEVKIRDAGQDTASLSAADSQFQDHQRLAVVNTSSGSHAILLNVTSVGVVKLWITQQRGYYDPDSREPPRDFQTVLEKDPQRFHPTGKVERRGERRVFEELNTGRLYYVDSAHPGHSAHLEVFSPNFEHLGTADITNGDINSSGKVKGRKLKL